MRQIAIITARGGSKRIPRKNIKEFCGRPILAYSIDAALRCGIFDVVMVSTDDEEIAEAAKRYGAEVPFFRSPETSNDYASTPQVLTEVMGEYRKRGQEFDLLCGIYPTAPFLRPETLKAAMDLLAESGADAVQPVVRFDFPPQRGVVIKDGEVQFKWPQYRDFRSQDLEPFYHDVGQFYCLNARSFEVQSMLVMARTLPFVMSELEVQDIDTEEDWKLAELKYRLMHENKVAEV